MTIENGLDTPAVAELDRMLEAGSLDPRVSAYLTVTRAQSIGWMLHDKAVCNILRVSSYILRKLKAAVAKLPGVTRVRFSNHKGVEYDGLLIGDHAEGEGYDVVGHYVDGRLVPGPPPAVVPAPDFSELHPTNHSFPPAPAARRPRLPWSRKKDQPKTVEEPVQEEAPAPEERVTPSNSEARLMLAAHRQSHPEHAPGCAVLDAILDHKWVALKPGHWQGTMESLVSAFTVEEAYQAVEHVAAAGQPFTVETVADAIRLLRLRAARAA